MSHPPRIGRGHRLAGRLAAVVTLGLLAGLLPATGQAGAPAASRAGSAAAIGSSTPQEHGSRLHLVTLTGGGLAAGRHRSAAASQGLRARMHHDQDTLLDEVGAGDPVYRWTTALNGVAVRLTSAQAARLATDPAVARVEPNRLRRLTGASAPGRTAGLRTPARRSDEGAGAGVVIGTVDSGLWPESPLFAPSPAIVPSRTQRSEFRGACQAGQSWSRRDCTDKIAGARWFVEGYGRHRLRASSSLSPRDDRGHGTQVASIAAGNAGTRVDLGRRDGLDSYAGRAPRAMLAIYKTCWTAPDPRRDGCATADVVTAIDRAVRDRVDVLSVPISGPATDAQPGFDTVERALLGAAEADIVVVAAGGNDGSRSVVAHPAPWVTTVGAAVTAAPRGQLVLPDGPRLTGAMTSRRSIPRTGLVRGVDVPAAGTRPADARICRPGSLDSGQVAGRIVVCERGTIGRVDKSQAVALADGAAMVLVNDDPRQGLDTDAHAVPTVQLNAEAGHRLRAWLRSHPQPRASLRPDGHSSVPIAATGFSASGDPSVSVVKPDLIAPGTGILGAVGGHDSTQQWSYLTATSASTAVVAGEAAALRARYPRWSAAEVRSALATSSSADGQTRAQGPLRQGAGRLSVAGAADPGLLFDVSPARYRRYLEGRVAGPWLNTPSLRFDPRVTKLGRSVRALGPGRSVWRVRVEGIGRTKVSVAPAAMVLRPGQVARFRMQVFPNADGMLAPAEGYVVWSDQHGRQVRIPVVVSR